MTEIVIHIHLGDGLMVRIPADWEHKHFDRETLRAAAEKLANRLGGSVLFIEDKEQQ